MRILVAPDKFKGTLTAPEAARMLCTLLGNRIPGARILPCPVADGGDGTLQVLQDALGLDRVEARALDPLGRPRTASYGRSGPSRLAVIEMALASGLSLLSPDERDPLRASSHGTGGLVLEAARSGAREILVALGGSATVDGGVGFLQALGARFQANGPLPEAVGGGTLDSIRSVDFSPVRDTLKGIRLAGLYDVELPLLGPSGTRLFMSQKGASPEQMDRLEKSLGRFERILSRDCGRDLEGIPGTGAAGGLGLALLALGGTLESGFDRVAQLLHLEDRIRDCDAVVTGEGRLDEGSRGGKAPVGVARLARKAGKPCVAVCGSLGGSLSWLAEEGFTGVYPLFENPLPPGAPEIGQTGDRMARAIDRLAREIAPGKESR